MNCATEVDMVRIAKERTRTGQTARGGNSWFGKDGKRWPGTAFGTLLKGRENVDTDFFNGVVRIAAEDGQVDKAERWMWKLDSVQGLQPEVSTFNMLLRAQVKHRGIAEAEDWFARTTQRTIHPELGSLAPNAESYDIMIRKAAEDRDLPRLEKFLQEACDNGTRPSRQSFYGAVRALLSVGEPKRAHHWLEVMVKSGCSKCKGYPSTDVWRVQKMQQSSRPWDPTELVEVVLGVVHGLAGIRNTETANQWLAYLVKCGEKPEKHAAAWDFVRSQTPPVIVPARLTADGDPGFPDFCPEPTHLMPATLSGEAPRRPPVPGLPYCEMLRSPGVGFISARTLRPSSVADSGPPQEQRSAASSSLSARLPEGGQRSQGRASPALSAGGARQARKCLMQQPAAFGGRDCASPSRMSDGGRPVTPMSPGLRRLVELQRRSPTPVLGEVARGEKASS